jgi:hypothetical protein
VPLAESKRHIAVRCIVPRKNAYCALRDYQTRLPARAPRLWKMLKMGLVFSEKIVKKGLAFLQKTWYNIT